VQPAKHRGLDRVKVFLFATDAEMRLEQMKLDALRKEDEIRAKQKPVGHPTMQQAVKQVRPGPKSRDTASTWQDTVQPVIGTKFRATHGRRPASLQ
jgi:hypothetical protein